MDFETPDITEFINACAKQFCPWCGEPVERNAMGRPRAFCSDHCRYAFHNHKRHQREKERREHDREQKREERSDQPSRPLL